MPGRGRGESAPRAPTGLRTWSSCRLGSFWHSRARSAGSRFADMTGPEGRRGSSVASRWRSAQVRRAAVPALSGHRRAAIADACGGCLPFHQLNQEDLNGPEVHHARDLRRALLQPPESRLALPRRDVRLGRGGIRHRRRRQDRRRDRGRGREAHVRLRGRGARDRPARHRPQADPRGPRAARVRLRLRELARGAVPRLREGARPALGDVPGGDLRRAQGRRDRLPSAGAPTPCGAWTRSRTTSSAC